MVVPACTAPPRAKGTARLSVDPAPARTEIADFAHGMSFVRVGRNIGQMAAVGICLFAVNEHSAKLRSISPVSGRASARSTHKLAFVSAQPNKWHEEARLRGCGTICSLAEAARTLVAAVRRPFDRSAL